MKKLLLSIILFVVSLSAYAACSVYYTSYVLNGKTVYCSCIVCGNITDCQCN